MFNHASEIEDANRRAHREYLNMPEIRTITEAAPTSTGVRIYVGLVIDTPTEAKEWLTKLEEMVAGTTPSPDTPTSPVNPTVKKVLLAAFDDGAPLDPSRYDVMLKALVEVTTAGEKQEIPMAELAEKVGVATGTIRAMNTKLSIRIGRVLEKRAAELKSANPPFPAIQRNIDALLKTTWDKGNPSYRLQPSALSAVQEWLEARA